jgi:hypothetical protein
MISRAKDSLEVIEMVIWVEEIFEADIRGNYGENFAGPRDMVDWLESKLSNHRPNKQAATLLRKLAKDQQRPELAEGLDGAWRREQIAAIVREIYDDRLW